MAFSSGTYSLYTPGNPVVTGTTIASTWGNNTLNDIATALSTCVLKDGSQVVTANITMSSFRLTNLAAATAVADAPRVSQVQNSSFTYLTSVGGTVDVITATATPTPAAYVVGQQFTFLPSGANTGATTLNIGALGAGAVQIGGGALVGGELNATSPVTVEVSATTPVFQIIAGGQVVGTTASTFTFDGSGGTSGSVTMRYRKVDGFVTLYLPAVTGTTGTSSTTFTANTALPAAFRPATATQGMPLNNVGDNGLSGATAGIVTVSTAGVVVIKRTATSTAFTNAATAGTIEGNTFTYYVGTGS